MVRTSYADESQPESGQAPGHVATVRAAGKPAVLSTSGLRLHQGAWASIGFNDAGDGAGHALALPLFQGNRTNLKRGREAERDRDRK